MQTLQFVILFALFLLTVWLFFLNSRANHPSWAALEHRRYAHRGLHCSADSVPENSLAAFRRAIRHGYGAELDVHLLRDGTLAVFHDSDLKRMTGVTGVLEDCTAQDLAALHLASTPETIPQLCEVLSLYEGTGLPLVVELKSYRGNHRALTERTAKELDKYQIPYCMESFDPRCLMWLRLPARDHPRSALRKFPQGRAGLGAFRGLPALEPPVQRLHRARLHRL